MELKDHTVKLPLPAFLGFMGEIQQKSIQGTCWQKKLMEEINWSSKSGVLGSDG